MKFSKKTATQFLLFFLLGITVGTLLWELLARLIQIATGITLDVSIGPIGFDIHVISIYVKLNIGSIPGAIMGWLLFSKL